MYEGSGGKPVLMCSTMHCVPSFAFEYTSGELSIFFYRCAILIFLFVFSGCPMKLRLSHVSVSEECGFLTIHWVILQVMCSLKTLKIE
jgi:hypothetical protein